MSLTKKYFFLIIITTMISVILTYPTLETCKIVIDRTVYVVSPHTRLNVRLEYEHSVELSKITEEYEITNCEVKLMEFVWVGYGAGLPSRPCDAPNQLVGVDGGYIIRNITLNVTTLKISMRYRVNPRITINEKEVESKEEVVIEACSKISVVELVFAQKLR